VLKMTMDNYS